MEQNKIWDYFQNEEINSFEGSYARLYDLIKKFKKGDKVLNIGVGGGIFEKLAKDYGLDVYSLDPSEETINRMQKYLGSEHAKVGYSQDIPYKDNFFDGVVMSEVIEHLNDETINATIFDVKRVLKNNAIFIGTVPYKENLDEQATICPKCGEKFHRWGHVQSFDISRMSSILKKAFSSIVVRPKMYISWNTLNWKGKISTFFNYIFFKIGIKKSGLNLYFESRKI